MPPTRRRLLLGAAATLATPHIARAARRRMTVGAFDDVFQTNYEQAVVEPFRRAHPDIDVSYYPVTNSEQLVSLLRMSRAGPPVDVALLELTAARGATMIGVLAPLSREMPEFAGVPAGMFIPGVAGLPVMIDCLAIAYAPARVVPPPRAWRALWEQNVGGPITLNAAPDPAGLAFTLVANALFGSENYQKSFAGGIDAIRLIAPRVVTWYPLPDVYGAIIDGVASLGVAWNARGQMLAGTRLGEGKLAMALPREGSVPQVITINLAAGSRIPDAARAFIAYTLSPEAQQATATRLFYGPVNSAGLVPPAVLARTAAAPDQRERMMEVDWTRVMEMSDDITREWRRRIIPHR
jgi:putative spermidine/putrescine transport system substrate-binding protein